MGFAVIFLTDCKGVLNRIAIHVSSSKNPPSELILINYEVNILVLRHNKNLFYKKAADYFEKEKGRNKA